MNIKKELDELGERKIANREDFVEKRLRFLVEAVLELDKRPRSDDTSKLVNSGYDWKRIEHLSEQEQELKDYREICRWLIDKKVVVSYSSKEMCPQIVLRIGSRTGAGDNIMMAYDNFMDQDSRTVNTTAEDQDNRATTTEYKAVTSISLTEFNEEVSKLMTDGFFLVPNSFTAVPMHDVRYLHFAQALARDIVKEEG